MRCRFARSTLTLVHCVLPTDSPKMTRCQLHCMSFAKHERVQAF